VSKEDPDSGWRLTPSKTAPRRYFVVKNISWGEAGLRSVLEFGFQVKNLQRDDFNEHDGQKSEENGKQGKQLLVSSAALTHESR